ncbi:carboxypeptidase-like regulatory domain-containing protein [Porphyromonas uenonis]|uniref:carboxypeptidase-like regulatory domain-containing protein n=1 Tax=Porphyromonas uenonis TaxID=281920 RepID=UPI000ACDF86C|nr:carboxypeptidase-like regulatory domain-containing protein [Porphyromonas uenonis]
MRSLHYIVLLLCVLLQGCALALHGQTTGQATDTMAVATPHRVALTGYVLDRDREPIEFASVRVEGTSIGTWSDLTGAYRLELAPTTDSVVVTYSSIGYQTVRQVYPQGISRDMHFNPMLGENAINLGTVTVRGEARPPSMERITTQTLAMEASPTRSIESMVATYAGVTQHNELSTQYNVRGGSFDENLVYVNGIEVYRPLLVRSAEQEGLSFVNTDLVERVYFSAGASMRTMATDSPRS